MALPRSPARALFAGGLFLVVLGCKFAVLDRFGYDLPLWDQWDAAGNTIFVPYFQERLTFADFLRPHNEHRIVWTKALSLALVIANGQWDVRLECMVNAIIHAALATAVFAYGCGLINRGWWFVWAFTTFALTGLPAAWHNVVASFHSQQYFLLSFSLLTIALLAIAPAWSRRWWLGLLCGAAALVSMGAGFIAAVAVAAILLVDGSPQVVLRKHWPTLVACLLLVLIGWITRVEVAHHATLQARSFSDFALTLLHFLEWPVHGWWFAVLGWLPWSLLAWRHVFRESERQLTDRAVVAVGLWVLLIYCATAYARGAGAPWPPSRYIDNVTVGFATNVIAAIALLSRASRNWQRWTWRVSAAIAIICLAPAYIDVIRDAVRNQLPELRSRMNRIEANTRAFVATNDRRWLESTDIAFPHTDIMLERLSQPELRAVLPVSVRQAVELQPREDNPAHSFAAAAVAPEARRNDAVAHWGSFGAEKNSTLGSWHSATISPSRFRYWRMELAPAVDQANTSVHVAEPHGREFREIRAGRKLSTGWGEAVFVAPVVPCELVAHDRTADSWVGFTAPTEMAAGSYWARRAAGGAWLLIAAGATLLVAGIAALLGPVGSPPLLPSTLVVSGPSSCRH